MRFNPTPLQSAYTIDLEPKSDERGFFARAFCAKEFAQYGLETEFVQTNCSYSAHKGTLRGMHYQLIPMDETKLVRCIRGSLYDVILDLREKSPTFGHSFGTVLSAENRTMMLVPKGFAHGFLSLEDHTEILYMVSQYYSKELERGIRWDDPRFAIKWPEAPVIISERDQKHPNFDSRYHLNPCSSCGNR